MKTFTLAIFLLLALGIQAQHNNPNDIVGVWRTPGDDYGHVQIWESGGKYYGKIVYLSQPNENGVPRVNKHSPDPSKRNEPVINLQILKDFKFDGSYEWNSGFIYDPKSGDTYKCFIVMKDWNKIKVRGYVGVSLLGRTEYWTRVQ